MGSHEFRMMCKEFKPQHSENVGYMIIMVDKEWYHPGQTVKGRIFFDLFIPCFQNKLMVKLEGTETFPKKYVEHVFEDVLSDKDFDFFQQQIDFLSHSIELADVEEQENIVPILKER